MDAPMTGLDPLILSRLQFAATISFHILFPTITIARGSDCSGCPLRGSPLRSTR